MKKIFLCLLLLCAATSARALDWDNARGQQINALLNARDGFWVGTADRGLWRRDAQGAWKQFLAENTVRCLLERGNQIWAGTARDGLQIWDGAQWNTVGVAAGLPSARVNDLALDFDSGDVWVATENGLARWNDASGWNVPDADLARKQIVGVAAARGNVWAATACDGLLKSSDRGATWTQIKGAPIQPDTATGTGLPSPILNDVAVDELGQIWVATDYGLAKSKDEGASWFYMRGADWEANVTGSAEGLKPKGADAPVEPPGEDWVQTVAPDNDGHIWLGFRQQGAEIRDIQTDELLFATRFNTGRVAGPGQSWVRAIVPLPEGRAILGEFGGGLDSALKAELPAPSPARAKVATFKIPGAFATLNPAQIARIGTDATASKGALWNMDTRTRGDWVGRYGDRLASVYERPWERIFQRDKAARVEVRLGWNSITTGPYTFIASLSGADPDVLYNPAIGTRRMDEVNDGTWQTTEYPLSFDGPNLWCEVEVGAGAHRVSLYFYNSDGKRDGNTLYRDYVLQFKPWSADFKDAENAPDLARCRVSDFQNGTYASFAVPGPGQYWIKVGRHRSVATKFSGVFIDHIGETVPSASDRKFESLRGETYQTQSVPAAAANENAIVTAARAAWLRLDERAARGEVGADDWTARHQLLRAASAADADEKLLYNWRWKLGVWEESDRAEFGNTMARIENKRVTAQEQAEAF